MSYTLEPLGTEHRSEAVEILNHYVLNGFAVYFESAMPESFFDRLLELGAGLPALAARTAAGQVAGFGFLRPYHPASSFRKTAEIAYFLHPDHTRQGLGGLLLDALVERARERGIENIIAGVSSLNEPSLAFHRKHGFIERGRLQAVGNKHGHEFDMVLFQYRH